MAFHTRRMQQIDQTLPSPRALDHPVLLVKDMDEARALWVALGFELTPVATHPWGTSNSCIVFENTYIELLYIPETIKQTNEHINPFLDMVLKSDAQNIGFAAVALRGINAQYEAERFAALNATIVPPMAFSRALAGDENKSLAFELSFCPVQNHPALGLFSCVHQTPELLFSKKHYHSNKITGFSKVTYCARDITDVHEPLCHWGNTLDMDVSNATLQLPFSNGLLEGLTPDALKERTGLTLTSKGYQASWCGITFEGAPDLPLSDKIASESVVVLHKENTHYVYSPCHPNMFIAFQRASER